MTTPTFAAPPTTGSHGLPDASADAHFDGHPILVTAWEDADTDRDGFDPRSRYVETFWLPILGPSTTLLFRRLSQRLEEEPAGFELDADATARALGLGGVGGRHSPFRRAIERGVRYGFARREGRILSVRRRVAPLGRAQVARLGASLQEHHREWEADPMTWTRRELFATTALHGAELLVAGHRPAEVEAMLAARGTHPALAYWASRPRNAQDSEVPPSLSDSSVRTSVRTPKPVAPFAR
jgi:hypothetical protein